jgi:hypothetical protein
MYRGRLTHEAFLRLIELFADGAEANRIAETIDSSHVTVGRIQLALRKRIARAIERPEKPLRRGAMPEALMRANPAVNVRGRRPTTTFPVAVVEFNGPEIYASVSPGFPREMWRYLDLEPGGVEILCASEEFQEAVALIDLKRFEVILVSPARRFEGPSFRVSDAARIEAFAEFLEGPLKALRGIRSDRLWLHLAELQFRFNHGREGFVSAIVEMLEASPLRLDD